MSQFSVMEPLLSQEQVLTMIKITIGAEYYQDGIVWEGFKPDIWRFLYQSNLIDYRSHQFRNSVAKRRNWDEITFAKPNLGMDSIIQQFISQIIQNNRTEIIERLSYIPPKLLRFFIFKILAIEQSFYNRHGDGWSTFPTNLLTDSNVWHYWKHLIQILTEYHLAVIEIVDPHTYDPGGKWFYLDLVSKEAISMLKQEFDPIDLSSYKDLNSLIRFLFDQPNRVPDIFVFTGHRREAFVYHDIFGELIGDLTDLEFLIQIEFKMKHDLGITNDDRKQEARLGQFCDSLLEKCNQYKNGTANELRGILREIRFHRNNGNPIYL
jgi:hypothetical protein